MSESLGFLTFMYTHGVPVPPLIYLGTIPRILAVDFVAMCRSQKAKLSTVLRRYLEHIVSRYALFNQSCNEIENHTALDENIIERQDA